MFKFKIKFIKIKIIIISVLAWKAICLHWNFEQNGAEASSLFITYMS